MLELSKRSGRSSSIDAFRGLAMILMALDHTRDYFSNYAFSPTDLNHPNVEVFFLRWVTHFCAPWFVFLAGVGVGMSLLKGKSPKEMSFYLFSRGIWLIFLELFVIRFACFLDYEPSSFYMGVIWSLGISMVIMAPLIFLPRGFLFCLGITGILGHNLFDFFDLANLHGMLYYFAFIFQVQKEIHLGQTIFDIDYPFAAWTCLMMLGLVFSSLWRYSVDLRSRLLLQIGSSSLILFVLLKAFNIYGDPYSFHYQGNFSLVFLSFLNNEKYPPSFLFLLMTIGSGILVLSFWEKRQWEIPLLTKLGRVPMMFYLIHFPLINGVAWLWYFIHDPQFVWQASMPEVSNMRFLYGFSPLGVLCWWLLFVLLLFPFCLSYANFKKNYPHHLCSKYL